MVLHLANLMLTGNQAGGMWKLLDEQSHTDRQYWRSRTSEYRSWLCTQGIQFNIPRPVDPGSSVGTS